MGVMCLLPKLAALKPAPEAKPGPCWIKALAWQTELGYHAGASGGIWHAAVL